MVKKKIPNIGVWHFNGTSTALQRHFNGTSIALQQQQQENYFYLFIYFFIFFCISASIRIGQESQCLPYAGLSPDTRHQTPDT